MDFLAPFAAQWQPPLGLTLYYNRLHWQSLICGGKLLVMDINTLMIRSGDVN